MNRHDLGIHTEQIGASMARMIQQGVVTNRYKNLDKGWSVGAFIIADNFTYNYLSNHPRVMMRRGRYTNDPMIIAQQDNMVSINAALQIDLTGQVAAEAIANVQWSGTGGATDYAYGAYHSKGGRAMLCRSPLLRRAPFPELLLSWIPAPLSLFLVTSPTWWLPSMVWLSSVPVP